MFIQGRKALKGEAKLSPVPTLPPLGAALRGWSSLTPLSRGLMRLKIFYPFHSVADFRSSHSFRRNTRCDPASAIRSSCLWILGVKPSDIFIRCAVNVSMFCSRSCVRLQRGSVMSIGFCSECEPDETIIQIHQAVRRRQGAIWRKRCPGVTRAPFGLVCSASMLQHVCAGF